MAYVLWGFCLIRESARECFHKELPTALVRSSGHNTSRTTDSIIIALWRVFDVLLSSTAAHKNSSKQVEAAMFPVTAGKWAATPLTPASACSRQFSSYAPPFWPIKCFVQLSGKQRLTFSKSVRVMSWIRLLADSPGEKNILLRLTRV